MESSIKKRAAAEPRITGAESALGLALDRVQNLGVSPDGQMLALEFPQAALILDVDGTWAVLAVADLLVTAPSVLEAEAAMRQRITTASGGWRAREGCRTQLDRWRAPRTLELFVDQLSAPGAADCGVTRGPVVLGPAIAEVASTQQATGDELPSPASWPWSTRGCADGKPVGWVNRNGASLGRSCVELDAYETALPLALALSPTELLLGRLQPIEPFWYVPASRQRPFTRIRLEKPERTDGDQPRDPPVWRIVTFGPPVPPVQTLKVPLFEGDPSLVLSLTNGWHLFKGELKSSGEGYVWFRFSQDHHPHSKMTAP